MTPQASKNHRRSGQGQEGAALIMVLLIISILVVVVMEGVRTIQVDMASTAALQKGFESKYVALSGLEMAKRVLAEDWVESPDVDHEGEPWSDFVNQEEVSLPDMRETVEGFIRDEQSRFPVNSLVTGEGRVSEPHRAVLRSLLTGPGFELEPEEADSIISAVVDWLDADQVPAGSDGAEGEWYKAETPGVEPRNGPLKGVAELRFIRGITETLYFGTAETPGLKDLVTLHGEGRININTAPPLLLAAMIKQEEAGIRPGEALDFAGEMIRYRETPLHFEELASPQWYTNVIGSLSIHFHDLVTTQSGVYSVHLTARSGSRHRGLFAVLERGFESEEGRISPKLETIYVELQ